MSDSQWLSSWRPLSLGSTLIMAGGRGRVQMVTEPASQSITGGDGVRYALFGTSVGPAASTSPRPPSVLDTPDARVVSDALAARIPLGVSARLPNVPAPPDREASDFDAIVEETRRGLHAIVRGDPGPMKSLFSHGDDVSLANPFGPPRLGRTEVENAMEQAAANFKDGSVRCEEVSRYVTPELAYVVQLERAEAKVGGSEEWSRISLRVTMIFRREGDGWRIVHRHADPITSPRPVESIIETQAGA